MSYMWLYTLVTDLTRMIHLSTGFYNTAQMSDMLTTEPQVIITITMLHNAVEVYIIEKCRFNTDKCVLLIIKFIADNQL